MDESPEAKIDRLQHVAEMAKKDRDAYHAKMAEESARADRLQRERDAFYSLLLSVGESIAAERLDRG